MEKGLFGIWALSFASLFKSRKNWLRVAFAPVDTVCIVGVSNYLHSEYTVKSYRRKLEYDEVCSLSARVLISSKIYQWLSSCMICNAG